MKYEKSQADSSSDGRVTHDVRAKASSSKTEKAFFCITDGIICGKNRKKFQLLSSESGKNEYLYAENIIIYIR